MSTFTVVNDVVLADYIARTRAKLVFVAPGVSLAVAEALGKRFLDAENLSVTIVLDADPEVCRLGYGSLDGLKRVQHLAAENLLELRHQPGVRVGVLISDAATLVYAPVPLLIEAGSTQPDKPNALLIGEHPGEQIASAVGVSAKGLPSDAEIGTKTVTAEQVKEIAKDLEESPPKQFNIARVERVFSSRIQYVDFSLENYKLSARIASIPAELMGLADNKELRDRWRNSFRLLEGQETISVIVPELDAEGVPVVLRGKAISFRYDEKALEREKSELIEGHLHVIPTHGTFILRARRKAFDKDIERFKRRLADFKLGVEKELGGHINAGIARLVDYLLPRALEKPPPRFAKAMFGPTPDPKLFRAMLDTELRKAFGKAEKIFNPIVTVQYKDVTYESIHESKFRTALETRLGKAFSDKLFSEYDAAPEEPPPAGTTSAR